MCCFTAEEIWSEMQGEREESVMLSTWFEQLVEMPDSERAFWERLRGVREAVGPRLEELRRSKAIGSSLAAEITLEADGQLAEDLASVGDELRFFLISSDVRLGEAGPEASQATIEGQDLKFSVSASEHAKCVRCWHHRDSVGTDASHPELCRRCAGNIGDQPEDRVWA